MDFPLKTPLKRLSSSGPSPCAACTVRDWVFCNVLSEQELARLDEMSTHLDLSAKETIINEGDDAKHLFNVTEGLVKLYPAHVRTRKSLGDMTRKLSETSSHSVLQFFGTFSFKNPSIVSQNSLYVA